ncbi:hypothetical protein KAR91_12810, partial [Candidatus Pacearchaeota archaeon]|nr:hypothetical protein [Candidatus Pacearchaeota archaeon]
MGRFADALRQEPAQQPTQQVAQQPAQGGRFTQALRQTPEERTKLSREFTHPAPQEQQTTLAEENLPELGSGGLLSGEDPAKAAQMGFLLLSVTDPQEISKIVRSEFPHIKQQQDANRNEILFNPKTGAQIMINKPGLSKADILQGGATAAAFTPAGAFAAAGKTTASKVGRGALASGLTEAGFQGLQQQAGGEFDVPDVALATGLGGAAELVKPAIDTVGTAFKRRRLKKELGPDDIKTQAELEDVARLTEESRRVSRETKIPLTKAQQTGLESDLTRQRIVGSLSAGSRKARDFLKKQSQASLDAVDELLERVSPATAVETGETRFRTAAQKAIDARVASRKQKSDKLFKGAMKQGADVNLINTRSLIDKALGVAPEGSPLQREMTAIQRAIADGAPRTAVGTLTGPRKPSLRKLQLAKFQIDAVLDGSGGKVIDNVVKAEVV